jgi:muramoyltetrapeptide carboxypeptidase
MADLGLRVAFSPNSFAQGPGGFAGTDDERASDLMWAFKNPAINGIIANCGGWGCNRIVDLLDYDAIQTNPKTFMGYSDLTGCLSAITTKTGLQTFHGPMGAGEWIGTLNSFFARSVLMMADPSFVFASQTRTQTIVPGSGRGRLIGGNLQTFNGLLGSEYFPSMDEPFVMFLEDVGEDAEMIDRLLTALHLDGWFKNAQALVWGQCTACSTGASFPVDKLIVQKWGRLLNVPSFMGAMIGHIREQFILPWGGQVEVNATARTIKLLQAAVL